MFVVVVIIVFCFFKQKTAYEMRISDWSSDVCSSDLGPGRTATFQTAPGEITRDFEMLHVVPPQVAPQFIADSPLAAESGFVDVDQATLQIGRASCRERVCQYV